MPSPPRNAAGRGSAVPATAPGAAPPSRRHELLAAAGTGAAVAAAALACRAPGVLYADSGELLTAVAAHGIAHPPGFPLYLLLGGLWCDAARALGARPASSLNAFSSVCDGVAAAAAVLAALELLRRCRLALPAPARLALAAAAGLLFGLGPTLFDFSIGIEVYAIHAVFLAGALALALAAGGEDDAARRRRLTLACGGLAGGGLAVHHATMVVALPGLAVLLWGRETRAARAKRAALFAAGLLPGLLTYAVLPLRAARWPKLNWGNPSNLYRFWVHVSARDYQVNIESSLPVIVQHAGRFLAAYQQEFTAFGILAALAAAVLAFRRARLAVAGLVVLAAGDIAFAVRYEIAEDQAAYYIPTFLVTALLAAAGVALLAERYAGTSAGTVEAERAGRRRAWQATGAAVLAALALVFANVSARAGRGRDGRAMETADAALASLPPGALAFTPEWNVYAPVLAAQDVDGRRSDALVLDLLLLRRGWYLDAFARRHPERYAEAKAELDLYRTKLANWEEGRAYDSDELTRLYNAFTRKLVTAAFDRNAPVVWIGTLMTEHLPTGAALVPCGVGYRVLPSRGHAAVYLPDAPVRLEAALRKDLPEDEIYSGKIRGLYSGMLIQRGLYEAAFSHREAARDRLELANRVAPGAPDALEALGDLDAGEGRFDDALALYAKAVEAGGDAMRIAEKSRSAMAGKSGAR